MIRALLDRQLGRRQTQRRMPEFDSSYTVCDVAFLHIVPGMGL
jgi:hypothetical protein